MALNETEKEILRVYIPPELKEDGRTFKEYLCRVEHSYYEKIGDSNGPPIPLKPGDLVIYFNKSDVTENFFLNRLMPLDPGIPEEAEYICKRSHRLAIDNKY